jgi:predicted phage tail protein
MTNAPAKMSPITMPEMAPLDNPLGAFGAEVVVVLRGADEVVGETVIVVFGAAVVVGAIVVVGALVVSVVEGVGVLVGVGVSVVPCDVARATKHASKTTSSRT